MVLWKEHLVRKCSGAAWTRYQKCVVFKKEDWRRLFITFCPFILVCYIRNIRSWPDGRSTILDYSYENQNGLNVEKTNGCRGLKSWSHISFKNRKWNPFCLRGTCFFILNGQTQDAQDQLIKPVTITIV